MISGSRRLGLRELLFFLQEPSQTEGGIRGRWMVLIDPAMPRGILLDAAMTLIIENARRGPYSIPSL